jgi:hypothetical protein
VEAKQYSLCEEVLRRLHQAGVLDGIVVAGSWCMLFYQAYFDRCAFTPTIRTRDLDLAVPIPTRFRASTDVTDLLGDLGFVVDFRGREGHMRLLHPDLILEFLVPDRGRGSSEAFDIAELGVNAQPLRFLDLSLTETVTVDFRGIPVRLPHPVRFALHKLIVAERRKDSDKAGKDRSQAVMVMDAIIESGDALLLRDVYAALPRKWRLMIIESIAQQIHSDAITHALELV